MPERDYYARAFYDFLFSSKPLPKRSGTKLRHLIDKDSRLKKEEKAVQDILQDTDLIKMVGTTTLETDGVCKCDLKVEASSLEGVTRIVREALLKDVNGSQTLSLSFSYEGGRRTISLARKNSSANYILDKESGTLTLVLDVNNESFELKEQEFVRDACFLSSLGLKLVNLGGLFREGKHPAKVDS